MKNCAMWTLLAVLMTSGMLQSQAQAQGRGEVTISKALEVLDQMSRKSTGQVPPKILRGAQGIAIIPDQFKAGFVFGARYGRGLIVVRQDDGTWSKPVFISSFGGSFGLQAGAQATDLVLVFKGKKSVQSFLQGKGKLTMGVDASIAAGPVGRAAAAGTDTAFRAEILSYSRNRGVFAGVSAGGGTLHIDRKVNTEYYGQEISPTEILSTASGLNVPDSTSDLRRLLASITHTPEPKGKKSEEADDAANDEDSEDDEPARTTTKVEGAYTPRKSARDNR